MTGSPVGSAAPDDQRICHNADRQRIGLPHETQGVWGVVRLPVRFIALGIGVTAMSLFTAVLGWGHAERTRAPRAPLQPPAELRTAERSAPLPSRGSGRTEVTTPTATSGENRSTSTAHVVRAGETLSAIARMYRTDVSTIRQGNGLTGDRIHVGQRLLIPGAQPLRQHAVEPGDTLWEIAARYRVDLEELIRLNPGVNPGHLQLGAILVIPFPVSLAASTGSPGADRGSLEGLFAWPVTAPVSSYFGPRWGRNHAGIDLAANHGEPIRASRSGKVLLSGTVSGYGLTVVIQHPDGTRTLYAHCSELLVRSGQEVRQGELIARVGSTGMSTGPHLHFEIIVNERPRDPLLYLSK